MTIHDLAVSDQLLPGRIVIDTNVLIAIVNDPETSIWNAVQHERADAFF